MSWAEHVQLMLVRLVLLVLASVGLMVLAWQVNHLVPQVPAPGYGESLLVIASSYLTHLAWSKLQK